ncbi:AT-rich interactive domain-containing protein 2, variant 2 [Schistosoma haematobium]|uniref:AT-rich interactive domain-containing protein 2, variant 2 n=1 Tax=Schistosoma haematobium TaxID=6185 RepID=A0A922S368_SCHHA|nr:AT-rich interactive domain-containing protein 2, variant 2 [Schistosoma haematobium]KAH9591574.1 AT-rich interactive domain-containing protein 2, variant 2 [Schistosoma haematobium]
MSKNKSRFYSLMSSLPLCMKPYEQFILELQKLSRHNRQNAVLQPPYLFGHLIDLQKLYNEVALRGGHKQVTFSHLWLEVYLALGLPPGCVDAGHGLRTIYQRYLELFERNQRMTSRSIFTSDEQDDAVTHFDGDAQDFDQFLKSSRQNIYGASVRSNTEEIPNHLRKSWNLSIDLKDDFEYISLEKSLLSGLPNEIELALNTILLMSSQPNDFSISKNPRLLDVLLYTVGIYGPKHVTTYQYSRYLNFWKSNIDKENGRVFLSPIAFYSKELPEVIYDEFCYPPAVQEMTYGDEEAFRVQLVATVLRNLAVDDGLSAVIIGRNPQALRFIFLCIYSKHSCLHQLGLEILSSLYFPVLGSLIPALHRLLTTLLVCPDRIDRIRGLQIVKNLCSTPLFDVTYDNIPPVGTKKVSLTRTGRNIAFLTSLPPVTFSSIASTLCLRDLHLVVLAIDTIHSLTCLGPTLCDRLLQQGSPPEEDPPTSLELHIPHQNSSLLSLLVALLNLEAQAMGSDSLIRVRVMQALGTESTNTKPSVSKPSFSTASPLSKTISTTIMQTTSSSSCIPPQNPTVTSSTNSTVQLPVYCAQPNLTISLNHPSCCTSYHLSVCDTLQTPTGKTSIPTAPSYFPHNLIGCSSPSTTFLAANSSVSGVQNTDSSRVNKRDLLVRNCLPVITTPRVNLSMREFGTVASSTQQGSGSSSTSKPGLSVIQSSHITSTMNSATVNTSISSTNDLMSKVCLPQKLSSTPALNTPTINSEIQKHVNPPSKPLATENGIPQLDRREFMFEWLKSNYAVHNHSSIPRIQIYNEYQKAHLQRFKNIVAISPVDFHSQIKTIFPGVGQVKVQVPGGSVEIHYNNLKHVNAPEPESQQGINDIMASVLSPTKIESMCHESRSPKTKCRKRPATGAFLHPASPKLASKIEDLQNQVLKSSQIDVCDLNGHLESSKLTNGQLVCPLNGLSRDTTDVLNMTTRLHNGSPLRKLNASLNTNEDGCVQKKCTTPVRATAVVSLPDSKIMIVPVFTTYGMGHNLTLNGTPTSEVPMMIKMQTSENHEINKANNTIPICSNIDHTTTISKTKVNVITSSLTPNSISSTSSDRSCKLAKQLDDSIISGNYTNRVSTDRGKCVQLFCIWDKCMQTFSESVELCRHFQNIHYKSIQNSDQIKCVWGNCSEVISGPSFDILMDHLRGKHNIQLPVSMESSPNGLSTNDNVISSAVNKNQPIYAPVNSETLSEKNPSHSSCQIEKPFVYDELQLSNILSEECRRALTGGIPNPPFAPTPVHEGPVTKHLRLTAALALRNLLQYSDVARRYVSSCENLLCDLAFANLESSPTIFECLTLLSSSFDENTPTTSTSTTQYCIDEKHIF